MTAPAAGSLPLHARPDPVPVGMGQIVDHFRKPKVYGLPRVVEFRHVTQDVQCRPGERVHGASAT